MCKSSMTLFIFIQTWDHSPSSGNDSLSRFSRSRLHLWKNSFRALGVFLACMGRQENHGLFPQFVTFFVLKAPLILNFFILKLFWTIHFRSKIFWAKNSLNSKPLIFNVYPINAISFWMNSYIYIKIHWNFLFHVNSKWRFSFF